ncbi:MAG: YidC/Oxa1 family membrane protein insertase [Bacteroidota bacterium]
MNNVWSLFVGSLQTVLFVLAHMYGGNIGLAIITLSFMVRLALLPLTLRLARRSLRQQMRLKEIQPELERLKKHYRNDPEKLSQKTLELYKKQNVQPLDGAGLIGNLLQLPIFAGLFSAIKQGIGNGGHFLWITDISQPDILLALMIAALTFVSSALSPGIQQQGRNLFMILPAMLTLFFVWRLSAGLGLYWAASSFVSILQAAILRRKPI